MFALRNLTVAHVFLPLAETDTPGEPSLGRAGQCRGGRQMKTQRRQVQVGGQRLQKNEQVRREIQSFLQALHSYPEHFSKNPDITFEEHHSSLLVLQPESRRRV